MGLLLLGEDRQRRLVLDADPTFRGRVLDADPLIGRFQSWDNDPAYADRVGRYRSGGPYMALTDKLFGSIFTYNRPGKATDTDAYGLLNEVAADAIRQGFDPLTGAAVGWLIEGSQSSATGVVNGIRNPRAEGCIPGVIGSGGALPTNWSQQASLNGLSLEVIGQITVKGLPGLRLRVFGTPTASSSFVIEHETTTGLVAAPSQTWALATSVALAAGSLNGISAVRYRVVPRTATGTGVAGGQIVTNDFLASLSATPVRVPGVVTITSDASTARVTSGVQFTYTSGVAIDATFDLLAPQMEQNYCSSSIILPSAGAPAAALRAPDNHRLTGGVFTTLFGVGAPEFTLILDVLPGQAAPASGGQVIAQFDDGTDNNRIVLNNPSGGLTVTGDVVTGGVSAGPTTSAGTLVPGTVARVGLRRDRNGTSVCKDGGALQGIAAAGPASLNTLRFGNRADLLRPWNSRIRPVRATWYAASDAKFQAACVPGADIASILG